MVHTLATASASSSIGSSYDGLHVACIHLDASGQRLGGSLAAGLSAITSLMQLNVSDNSLTSLAGLEVVPRLHTLHCRRNRLHAVLDYPAPSSGSHLRFADLGENSITGAVSMPADEAGRPLGVDAHPLLETLLIDGNGGARASFDLSVHGPVLVPTCRPPLDACCLPSSAQCAPYVA